jgi:DNA-binding NarL/FixJ family response regulator
MGAELQLLRLIERNLPNKAIATHLGISDGEVTSRLVRLHQTLGLTRPDDNPRLAAAAGSRTPSLTGAKVKRGRDVPPGLAPSPNASR